MEKSLYIKYGSEGFEIAQSLMKQMNITSEIPKDALIGIKPNLVVAKPSVSGATTDPQIVDGIITYLKENGHSNIVILEGSWVGDKTDRAFNICGYNDIAKKHGIKLIDLQKDSSSPVKINDLTLFICRTALSIDYMINVPVLKGHCQTRMTVSLKNMKGCIPNSEKRRYHTLGIHKPVASLNKILKSDLIIVDGIIGDLDYEAGGTPVNMNRLIAGKDPVLVDSYCASLMGIEKSEIEYINIAEKLEIGSSDLDNAEIIEINRSKEVSIEHKHLTSVNFSKYVVEKSACSACFAGLVHALSRLREKNELDAIEQKIYIGQYFKHKKSTGNSLGIGNCCKHFDNYVPGCPPKAIDIIRKLKKP
jgi:uncharacterized protein (DUF362 family)